MAASPEDERWQFRGRVVTEQDRGVRGARVSVWAQLGGDERPIGRVPICETVSATGGAFVVPFDALQDFGPLIEEDTSLLVVADAVGYDIGETSLEVNYVRYHADRGTPLVMAVHVDPVRCLKGRALLPDGRPAAGVNVVALGGPYVLGAVTEIDGSFSIRVGDVLSDDAALRVLAADYRYGRSRPAAVRAARGAEMRCPDLVLQPGAQGIRGVVRWPDGRPAAGVEVEFGFVRDDDEPDVEVVEGVAVPDYHDLLNQGGADILYLTTDRDGRFALRGLRCGVYQAVVGMRDPAPVRVTAGHTTELAYVYGTEPDEGPAQLFVDVVDEDGRRLPFADYSCRTWTGPEAAVAATQFARFGATPGLLATAQEYERGDGEEPCVEVAAAAFCVVEASYRDAGPVYATARLGPEQRRADLRLVLAPREQAGDLRVVARDADGEPVEGAWLRVARSADPAAVPVHLPGLTLHDFPHGALNGYWCTLGADGVARGLPAGPLQVELLLAPTGRRDELLSRHPTILRQVHIWAGRATTLDVRAPAGAPIVLRIQGENSSFYDQGGHGPEAPLFRVDARGRRQRLPTFQPLRGQHGHVPGATTLCTKLGYPFGHYRLELENDDRRVAVDTFRLEYAHHLGAAPAVVHLPGRDG